MKHLTLIIILFFSLTTKAQEYKTLTYFANDSTKVELDLFLPKTTGKAKLPLLIFMHGGGFGGGKRADGHHICKYASQNGYVAASNYLYAVHERAKFWL